MRPDCKNKRTFKFVRLLESVTSDEKGKSDKGVVFGAVVRCGSVRRVCRAGFVQKRRRAGRRGGKFAARQKHGLYRLRGRRQGRQDCRFRGFVGQCGNERRHVHGRHVARAVRSDEFRRNLQRQGRHNKRQISGKRPRTPVCERARRFGFGFGRGLGGCRQQFQRQFHRRRMGARRRPLRGGRLQAGSERNRV